MAAIQSNQTLGTVAQYGKDLWLGETGWARSQQVSAHLAVCSTGLNQADKLRRKMRTFTERPTRTRRTITTSWAARFSVGMARASIMSTGTKTHLRRASRASACLTSQGRRKMGWISVARASSRTCTSKRSCRSLWAVRVSVVTGEVVEIACSLNGWC